MGTGGGSIILIVLAFFLGSSLGAFLVLVFYSGSQKKLEEEIAEELQRALYPKQHVPDHKARLTSAQLPQTETKRGAILRSLEWGKYS